MMMKTTRILILSLIAVISTDATAAEQLTIDIYDGPTECNESDKVKVADRIGMHYTGTIDKSSKTGEPGYEFDSSLTRDVVLDVNIGVGELIEGWEKGLLGLCKGAKAILIIPPELGYGQSGAGDGVIPGGATLRFDLEVISVTNPPPLPNLFDELDVDEDGYLTELEIHAHFRKEGPDAEMPPDLMGNDDKNGDGVVSREEFGGPKAPWEMCLEMLHPHRNSERQTMMGLAVQWICQRPRDLVEQEEKGSEEL